MPTWKEEMEMPGWKRGFYSALGKWLEEETGDREIVVTDVGDENYLSGCETCNYGARYEITICYNSPDVSYGYYTYEGTLSELVKKLEDAEI